MNRSTNSPSTQRSSPRYLDWQQKAARSPKSQTGLSESIATESHRNSEMKPQRRRATRDNASIGPTLADEAGICSLQFNMMNEHLSKKRIGSTERTNLAEHYLRMCAIPELKPILGTLDDPIKPKHRRPTTKPQGRSKLKARSVLERYGSRYVRKPNKNFKPEQTSIGHYPRRVQRAIRQLEKTRSGETFFLTLVTTIANDLAGAKAAVVKDAKAVGKYLLDRIPSAAFLIFPEFDLKRLDELPINIVPNRSWRNNLQDGSAGYKVHVHAVIHAPGMTATMIEEVFQLDRRGKASRKWSAPQQVRVIPVRTDPCTNLLEVRKCVGYATKNFFHPPHEDRPLELCAEWHVITNDIWSDPNAVAIGGFRKNPHFTQASKQKKKPVARKNDTDTSNFVEISAEEFNNWHNPTQQKTDSGMEQVTNIQREDQLTRIQLVLNSVSASVRKTRTFLTQSRTILLRLLGRKEGRTTATNPLGFAARQTKTLRRMLRRIGVKHFS